MQNLLRTPLFDFHVSRGARMVPFAGWEMPVQYAGILAEHMQVRQSAGCFDVSHMGQIWVAGPGAAAFLDYVCVSLISAVEVGSAAYSILCNQSGGAIDDVIIYRITDTQWLVIVNASNVERDVQWFSAHATRFNCAVQDVSDQWGLLAVQGPQAIPALLAAGMEIPDGRFQHLETIWRGISLRLCRTGYTGEDGVECLVPSGSLVAMATHLTELLGEAVWCGLGARDSLRLEAGLPLYGHELTEELGPLEARMGWTVDFSKAEFIGREALLQRKADPARKIARLFATEDRRIARPGSVVSALGAPVGVVLSGSLSPVLDCGIGTALVPRDTPDHAEVDVRGKLLSIRFSKRLK